MYKQLQLYFFPRPADSIGPSVCWLVCSTFQISQLRNLIETWGFREDLPLEPTLEWWWGWQQQQQCQWRQQHQGGQQGGGWGWQWIFFFKSIKCHTFSEPQTWPDFSDDDDNDNNDDNSDNNDVDDNIKEANKEEEEDLKLVCFKSIKCHTFLESQAQTDLNDDDDDNDIDNNDNINEDNKEEDDDNKFTQMKL